MGCRLPRAWSDSDRPPAWPLCSVACLSNNLLEGRERWSRRPLQASGPRPRWSGQSQRTRERLPLHTLRLALPDQDVRTVSCPLESQKREPVCKPQDVEVPPPRAVTGARPAPLGWPCHRLARTGCTARAAVPAGTWGHGARATTWGDARDPTTAEQAGGARPRGNRCLSPVFLEHCVHVWMSSSSLEGRGGARSRRGRLPGSQCPQGPVAAPCRLGGREPRCLCPGLGPSPRPLRHGGLGRATRRDKTPSS